MANDEKKLHIAMFNSHGQPLATWSHGQPFLHMIPYLELTKLIASKGHRITFVSTPRNIDRHAP
jgi:hypothetical protein